MGWFVLNSDITIGTYRFSGVHQVRVTRSIHSYMDRAVISLPSICKVSKAGESDVQVLKTAAMFAEGDAVTINLGYNDKATKETGADEGAIKRTPVTGANNDGLWTVFRGFVSNVGKDLPVEIECEGYGRKLRDINVSRNRATMRVKELLDLVKTDKDGKSTGIDVVVAEGANLHLQNIRIQNNNGIELIENVKRFGQGILNVFFIEPDVLWCGLTYTPYSQGKDPFGLGEVNYRLGYNVPQKNHLRMRKPLQRVQMLFGNTMATGKKVEAASDAKTALQRHKRIVNNIGDLNDMKAMAQEAQYKMSYTGYDGSLTAFLQPACGPGWIANISNRINPSLDGKYMIEGTEVSFGMNGARIKVDLGPQLGFKG